MEADFVIIGAGSAGCAMAYRLSATGASVLVIEFGGTDAGPLIQMPGALSYPMNMARYDWGYKSEPEPHLGGRRLACPRGKVIGGSSSINGMVYVRGHARDFDTWSDMGARGWAYADVLPYYKRMECWDSRGHGGDASWRGTDGPLHVTRGTRENPLTLAFVKAGQQAGYELTDDYNGEKQEGFGPMEQTTYKGQRWSGANAYLKPALKRPNCEMIRGLAEKVIIEDGRAVGVQVRRGEQSLRINARREVIIAASSINSPKLLMLSGIGPAAHLAEHNIAVVADRAGVGQNLQDHLELYIQMAASQPISLYKYWNLLGKAWVGANWLFGRRGPGASNQFESAAFIRSQPGVSYPDIQYHFLPLAVRYDGQAAAEGHGFQAHVGPMRSASRGAVSQCRVRMGATERTIGWMLNPLCEECVAAASAGRPDGLAPPPYLSKCSTRSSTMACCRSAWACTSAVLPCTSVAWTSTDAPPRRSIDATACFRPNTAAYIKGVSPQAPARLRSVLESAHTPLFTHGALAHSSTSSAQLSPSQPFTHVQK
jgi:choline dehydrogenase